MTKMAYKPRKYFGQGHEAQECAYQSRRNHIKLSALAKNCRLNGVRSWHSPHPRSLGETDIRRVRRKLWIEKLIKISEGDTLVWSFWIESFSTM